MNITLKCNTLGEHTVKIKTSSIVQPVIDNLSSTFCLEETHFRNWVVTSVTKSLMTSGRFVVQTNDLAKTHKLYRLAAYRRCSRWVFQILGKKCRQVFTSCIYTSIRNKFPSPDGLYMHFKFSS